MSPMVVFKYKATPVSVGGSSILGGGEEDGSDQDDEQGIMQCTCCGLNLSLLVKFFKPV